MQDKGSTLDEHTLDRLKVMDLAVNIYHHGRWGSYVHRQLRSSTGKNMSR
jgi:hypothetical protein